LGHLHRFLFAGLECGFWLYAHTRTRHTRAGRPRHGRHGDRPPPPREATSL